MLMRGIMRSFTSCQAADMDRVFWFSLLLTYLPLTESTGKGESCLSQPNKVIWRRTGQSVVLPCHFNSSCSATHVHYEWFSSKKSEHLRLNPLGNPHKYSLDGASLSIKSLDVNDSGIYYCAAVWRGEPARGAQYVGLGTTLVVRENVMILLRHVFLVAIILLVIYNVALVTFTLKKYGCRTSACRKMRKTDKNSSSKKRQFRNVLQEMYSRRNLEGSKETVSRNHLQVEATRTDFNNSADGIYQNI